MQPRNLPPNKKPTLEIVRRYEPDVDWQLAALRCALARDIEKGPAGGSRAEGEEVIGRGRVPKTSL